MAGQSISQMTAAGALGGTELLEIATLSSTVTITGTTISAQASDNSFNDSGNGFVTAGFAIGDRVKVTGFTGNTANNIFSALVTGLAAGKMTIGGTDGDVIVDDAAGESVTITKWVTRRADLSDIRGPRVVQLAVTNPAGDALTIGDGKGWFVVPPQLNGMNLIDADAALVGAVSTSGVPTIQIANATDAVDMLSTKITIDANEPTSYTAATPSVVNTSNDDVATGDILRVDIDVAGTGAKGLVVILTFDFP